jgi:MFS transporter, DHA1 family, tetracycline resistance protein
VSRPEPWLVSCGLLGVTQAGLVPVLMPLTGPHGSAAGLTFAAFSLSGVFAPILGGWADRTGRHRDLLIWGMLGAGALFLLYDAVSASLRILFAAGAGLGAVAATTAGNVIAIQGMPEGAWESRVALLQRFVSAGQVIGLVAAGLLAHAHPSDGFVFAGVALLAAGVLALVSPPRRQLLTSLTTLPPRPITGGDTGVARPHHHGHHFSWREFTAYLNVINRPMQLFLLIWLISYAAMNGFATLFPVVMVRQFGMNPILPSSAYAIGVASSLAIYPSVGAMTHRFGGERMLSIGFAARLAVLGLLSVLSLLHIGSAAGWVVLAGFALIQFVWPLIAIAANSLSVRLMPTARGESVGLFNAATSLASAAGSAFAGVINDAGGFTALAATAFVAVGAGLLLNEFRLRPHTLAPR